ncbi:ATP phosphoribosyltransferase [Candidatus Uhrbacteria bacterium]|nr:ATP phosphoribosyltransferase [Candidatus Uhrbacteria bacterium]
MTIRLALPKGRLFEGVREALATAGMRFTQSNPRALHLEVSDSEVTATLFKARAIPQLVAYGFSELGVTGRDCVEDAGYDHVVPLFDFGTNPVELVVAGAQGSDLLAYPPSRPLVIATEYEGIASRWAFDRGLAHIILSTRGATEAYAPGIADLVLDCVETGATIAANGLMIIERLLASSTLLVTNRAALEDAAHVLPMASLLARLHAAHPDTVVQRVAAERGAVGAAAIIWSGDQFLVQVKGENHPVAACRGRYCCFGGSLDAGELPRLALCRELREEIADESVAAAIEERLRPWRSFPLTGRQYPGMYASHVFHAEIPPMMFAHIASTAQQWGVTREGHAAIVSRSLLADAVGSPDRFVGSHEVILRTFLAEGNHQHKKE